MGVHVIFTWTVSCGNACCLLGMQTIGACGLASVQLPIIRDNLGADKWQLGNAGVAAVIGAIVCRMGMGAILDTFGPRIGTAATVLVSACKP
jgi:hypothetical protein